MFEIVDRLEVKFERENGFVVIQVILAFICTLTLNQFTKF